MLTDVSTSVPLQVCEACSLCEEIRRLAARIAEETSTTETLREGLNTLYQLARQQEDCRSQDVGSSEAESDARCKAEG